MRVHCALQACRNLGIRHDGIRHEQLFRLQNRLYTLGGHLELFAHAWLPDAANLCGCLLEKSQDAP